MDALLVGLALITLPLVVGGYAYLGYPLLLRAWARWWPYRSPECPAGGEWPAITITIPAYNEAAAIAATLERVLALSYPPDRRHVLVISDASTDGTDEVVAAFADRGVELLRLPVRSGKSAAENAAVARLRGDIVVNIDATIRVPDDALQALVAAFRDPSVGVASGRDVSVGPEATEQNRGESQYVGYEMRVRELETRVGSIVGASGCFYATRRALQQADFPEDLSRDFASAMIAREAGYRAVSVQDAVCFVPRTPELQAEYRRKVRTMARGLRTLWYKRHLMNPLRHGRFAWMLASHKLARWLVPLSVPLAVLGLGLLASMHWVFGIAAAGAVLTALVGWAILWRSGRRGPSSAMTMQLAFAVASITAGLVAWGQFLAGRRHELWEPTRRTGAGQVPGRDRVAAP